MWWTNAKSLPVIIITKFSPSLTELFNKYRNRVVLRVVFGPQHTMT